MSPLERFELQPLSLVQRLWYWRLHTPAPLSVDSNGPWHEAWVRLLPQHWSALHRAYAHRQDFFWLPCVLCDRHYGGHQSGGLIPDPLNGPGRSITICPRCTRAGRHVTEEEGSS